MRVSVPDVDAVPEGVQEAEHAFQPVQSVHTPSTVNNTQKVVVNVHSYHNYVDTKALLCEKLHLIAKAKYLKCWYFNVIVFGVFRTPAKFVVIFHWIRGSFTISAK